MDVSFGLGSVVGGGISAISNAIGNHQQYRNQLKLQKQAQQFNSAEAQKNRDFQQSMFDQTNAWNSAKAQVQRYRDAGLNPYMMMNNGNAGVAVGQQGSQAQSGGQSSYNPSYSGFSDLANSIGNAFQQLQQQRYDKREQDARIRQMESIAAYNDVQADVAQGRWNIDKTWLPDSYDADIKYKDSQRKHTDLSNTMFPFQSQLLMSQSNYYTESAAAERAQVVLTNLSAENQRILNHFLPQEMQAKIFTLYAQGHEAEANAEVQGVIKQLKGKEYDMFVDTYDEVCEALKAQNQYYADYYGNDLPAWARRLHNMISTTPIQSKGQKRWQLDFSKGQLENYNLEHPIVNWSNEGNVGLGVKVGDVGVNLKAGGSRHKSGRYGVDYR